MSLMQLLTVSRSFRSVRDRPTPYKMTEPHFLPRFGERLRSAEAEVAEVPFRREAVSKAVPRGSRVLEPAPAVPVAPGSALVAGAGKVVTGVPGRAVEALSGRGLRGSRRSRRARSGGGWFKLGNPFRREAGSRPMVEPVQGELALDSVRVVRNDLMETDFEVVPAPIIRVDGGERRGWARRLVGLLFGGV